VTAVHADPEARALASGYHLGDPVSLGVRLGRGRYQRARHLELLADRLIDGALGERPRQIISMPPRHGKSTTTSVWFPVWLLALWPEKEIILVSHSAGKATEWGRKVRNILDEFWPQLGVTLAEDSSAAYRWNTKEGGGMLCSGIGGAITGSGADVFIIDDPVKDAQEARSETIQKRNWEWYQSTASTRLSPDGCMIVQGTRWDENDLAGKLLQAQAEGPEAEGYDTWDVLNLPALAERNDELGRKKGEALWPERWNEEKLAKIKRSRGTFWWTGMYQGRPTPLGGGLFKEYRWNYWVPPGTLGKYGPVEVDGVKAKIIELPKLDMMLQSWDCNFRDSVRAIVAGHEPDPVAGHVWARCAAMMFMLDRYWSDQAGLNETIEAVREMSLKHPGAKAKVIEYTANGPAVMATLQHELGGFLPATPVGDKMKRATMSVGSTEDDRGARSISFAASQEAGDIYLPHPAYRPWVPAFRALMGKFPSDGKDDTDAASQAWARLQGPGWADLDRAHDEALKKKDSPRNTVEQLEADLRAEIDRRTRKPKRKGAWVGRNWGLLALALAQYLGCA
jgi:predicted phage terminase large subunit-like protein